MSTKKTNRLDAEWRRICSTMTSDNAHVRVPRAFLSTLSLFFHHVSDAMAGDDRPDHGLARMRESREHYRIPFYFLYGKLKRAEERMRQPQRKKAIQLLYQYCELLNERERQFQQRLKKLRQSREKGRKPFSKKDL